jgi:Methyltransferase domain
MEEQMLVQKEHRNKLNDFFKSINLVNKNNTPGKSKADKIEQIVAYLEMMLAQLRKYSKKRELVLIESGAGNCYLSFVLYYYCTEILQRPVAIHCLDINARLMKKAEHLAKELGFDRMHFHACDIGDYLHPGPVDVVFSLHACDSATDKSLYLGVRNNAKCILSVSCCQHTIKKSMRGRSFKGMTKHRVMKDRLVYMVGDSLRALLLESQGYAVDMIQFVSSRYTDKNVMIRAQGARAHSRDEIFREYERLQTTFNITPPLETYLAASDPSLRQQIEVSSRQLGIDVETTQAA